MACVGALLIPFLIWNFASGHQELYAGVARGDVFREDQPFEIELGQEAFVKYIRRCMIVSPEVRACVDEVVTRESPRKNVQQVYQWLQKRWTYKSDPQGCSQLQSASYSVRNLEGDCEDYASCLASCLSAIDATVRLVVVNKEEGCHCFCEMLVGNDDDPLTTVILDQFAVALEMSRISYRLENGCVWLALDFIAPTSNVYSGKVLYVVSVD